MMVGIDDFMAKTVGFYQNFKFDLQRLSNALRCIQSESEMSHIALARCMSVNEPVAEGFSSWLRHTGLITILPHNGPQKMRIYQLTLFGELAYRYDPYLIDIGTQWILHYYLATKRAESSDAWYILVNKYLPMYVNFTEDQFQSYFTNAMGSNIKNRLALSKDPLEALSTYTRIEALAKLHILEKQNKVYTVGHPHLPEALVAGYMLFDWWNHHYDQTNTLRFSQLCNEEESLGRICLTDTAQVRYFLMELSSLGYLSFSETQHEPVYRLYQGQPSTLLEFYYKQR